MTANQMAILFLDLLDKQTSNSAPGLSDEQISSMLTVGEYEWVKTRYTNNGNKYSAGFDSNELRRKGLSELIKTIGLYPTYTAQMAASNTNCAYGTYGYIDYIPSDQMQYMYVGLTIEYKLHSSSTWASTVVTEIDLARLPNKVKVDSMPVSLGVPCDIRYTAVINDSNGLSTLAMNGEPNGSLWYLPKDCLWLISEKVRWATTNPAQCWNGKFANVKPKTYDDYNYDIDNHFRKPNEDIVWRLDYSREHSPNTVDYKPNGDPTYPGTGALNDIYDIQTEIGTDKKRHILVTDGKPIDAYFITYLRRPRGIWVDTEDDDNQVHCEIDEAYHHEIVNEAVKIALSRLNDPRYQVQARETIEEE